MTSTGAASVGGAEGGQVSRRSQGSGSVKGRLDGHLDPVISALGVYPISVVHRGMYSDVPLKVYFQWKEAGFKCPPIAEAQSNQTHPCEGTSCSTCKE